MNKKLFAVVALLASTAAFAADPAMTFTSSVTNAAGSLSTRLNWTTSPAAADCVAAGHTSWTGSKGASGQLDLPAITLSGTYTLTLACSWPGATSVRLSWDAPTQNTDGSALAKCASQTSTGNCLRSFTVYRGATAAEAAGATAEIRVVNDRNATSYDWTGLSAGQHCFTVSASNGDGVASPRWTPPGCKTMSATANQQLTVTLTVNPVPSTPGNFTVQ